MPSFDFKKDPIYKAKAEPSIVDVPKMLFVMVDGEGAPESTGHGESEFQQAMQILYGLVYTIKFWTKKFPAPDGYALFTLAPIEALWWTKSGNEFNSKNPTDWKWTAMLRLPEFVTSEFFKKVVVACSEAKKSDIYAKARLEWLTEGLAAQVMYIGPYDQEDATILQLHAFAKEHGYRLTGKHHELYFSDPRRTSPEKLKTILRQPITLSR